MSFRISYSLYRSNPLVFREILIPSAFTLTQLSDAMCIGLGIDPSPSEMADIEGNPLEGALRIQDLIPSGPDAGGESAQEGQTGPSDALFEGSLTIFQNEKTRQAAALTLYMEIYFSNEETSIPKVIQATDYSLPSGIYQIAVLNEIALQLSQNGRATLPDGSTCYGELLIHSAKKIKRLFLQHFASDQVGLSLRTDVALPLELVLESRNLSFLKSLSDRLRCYPYQKKKQAYTSALAEKLSQINMKEVFKVMSIREYLNFRTLVTEGQLHIINQDDLGDYFPLLNGNGLIGFVKKKSVVIAEDIIRDYEEWFDQPQEALYFKNKRIRQVLDGCGKFYGVFTKAHCWKILNTFYPGQVEEAELDGFWNKSRNLASDSRLAFWWNFDPMQPVATRSVLGREPDAVYDKIRLGKWDKEYQDIICRVLCQDPADRYMPSLEEFEQMAEMGFIYSFKNRRRLYDALTGQASYYDHDTIAECVEKLDAALMQEAGDEAFLKIREHSIYWPYYSREEKTRELMELIRELRGFIPSMLDYGVKMEEAVKSDLSSPAREEIECQIRLAQEEEARRKASAAAAKKEAKKVPGKSTRTYGSSKKGRR